jgi:hypothetical protein
MTDEELKYRADILFGKILGLIDGEVMRDAPGYIVANVVAKRLENWFTEQRLEVEEMERRIASKDNDRRRA